MEKEQAGGMESKKKDRKPRRGNRVSCCVVDVFWCCWGIPFTGVFRRPGDLGPSTPGARATANSPSALPRDPAQPSNSRACELATGN